MISATDTCIVSSNLSFHAGKQRGSKLVISVFQSNFPSLFLVFNLIMTHPKGFGNPESLNNLFIPYEWNEMSMLTV